MNSAPTSDRAGGAARIREEHAITLLQAASVFPRGQRWRSVSVKTLRRWAISGKAGVRLETRKVRGELHTSIPAIWRFVAELELRGAV